MYGLLPMVQRLEGLFVFVHTCVIVSKTQAVPPEYEFNLQLYQPNASWLICPQGWTKFGTKCFTVDTDKATFFEAETVCRRTGGHVIEISTLNKNRAVARFLTQYIDSLDEVWIGLQQESTVSFKWTNGKVISWQYGIWSLGQPNVIQNIDQCVSMVIANTSEQFRWKLNHCDERLAFLCEVNACVEEEFRCQNGRCVPHSWHCDGQSDCEDFSDEQNCNTVTCGGLVQEPNFTIDYPGTTDNYQPLQHCQWLIEASVGTRIILNFQDFDTEPYHDIVSIFDGPTSGDAAIGTFSGTMLQNWIVSGTMLSNNIISTTNMLLVTFISDNSIQKTGFVVKWTQVNSTCGSTVVADDRTRWVASPNYPDGYPGNLVCKWDISSKLNVISIMLLDFHLLPGDFLEIRENNSDRSYVLAYYTGNATSNLLFTTGGDISLQLSTDLKGSGRGFNITYQTGCDVTIERGYGQISSPGYRVGHDYNPNLHCKIVLLDNEHRGALTMIFEHFDTELQFDYMEIYNSTEISGNSLLANMSGWYEPLTLRSSTGQLVLIFHTDSMLSKSGWNASFSYDCKDTDPSPINSNQSSSCVQYNSSIQYVCDTGYLVHGSSQRYCDMGGVWRTPPPSCTLKYCGPPPQLKNGRLLNITSRYYGGVSYYMCDEGYLQVRDHRVTCHDEGWTTLPACRAYTCPKLQPLQNGRTIPLHSAIYERVYFKCDDGYRLVGYTQAECSAEGTWSQGLPYCIRDISCPEVTVSNGHVLPVGPIRSQETIVVTCNTGYRLPDDVRGHLTCTDSGMYDKSVPACVDDNECMSMPCGNMHICYNTKGAFYCQCHTGYQHPSPADMKTCVDINECNSNNGGCEYDCENTAGSYMCICKDGYRLYTENDSLEIDAGLLLPQKSCYVLCPALSVANATKLFYSSTPVRDGSYFYPTSLWIQCPYNTVLDGPSVINCSESGQWSAAVSSCKYNKCTTIPELGNGTVEYKEQHDPFVDFVKFSCNQGYSLYGNKYRFCISGKWSGVQPFCAVVDCRQPPAVSHSDIRYDSTIYGSVVTYICHQGYRPLGEIQRTCLSSGIWSTEIIICIDKICPNPMLSEYITMATKPEKYVNGSLVTFTCDKPGYQLTDPFPIMCASADDDVNITIVPCEDYMILTLILTVSPVPGQNYSLQCNSTFLNALTKLRDSLLAYCQYPAETVDMKDIEVQFTSSGQIILNGTLVVLPRDSSYLTFPPDECLDRIGSMFNSTGCSRICAEVIDNCPLMAVKHCETFVLKIGNVCENGEAVTVNNCTWCIQSVRGPISMVDIEVVLTAIDISTDCILRLQNHFNDTVKMIVDHLDFATICPATPNIISNSMSPCLQLKNNQINLKMPLLLYDFTSPFWKVETCAALVANTSGSIINITTLMSDYCPSLYFPTTTNIPMTYTLCPQGFRYHSISGECMYCGNCSSFVSMPQSSVSWTTPTSATSMPPASAAFTIPTSVSLTTLTSFSITPTSVSITTPTSASSTTPTSAALTASTSVSLTTPSTIESSLSMESSLIDTVPSESTISVSTMSATFSRDVYTISTDAVVTPEGISSAVSSVSFCTGSILLSSNSQVPTQDIPTTTVMTSSSKIPEPSAPKITTESPLAKCRQQQSENIRTRVPVLDLHKTHLQLWYKGSITIAASVACVGEYMSLIKQIVSEREMKINNHDLVVQKCGNAGIYLTFNVSAKKVSDDKMEMIVVVSMMAVLGSTANSNAMSKCASQMITFKEFTSALCFLDTPHILASEHGTSSGQCEPLSLLGVTMGSFNLTYDCSEGWTKINITTCQPILEFTYSRTSARLSDASMSSVNSVALGIAVSSTQSSVATRSTGLPTASTATTKSTEAASSLITTSAVASSTSSLTTSSTLLSLTTNTTAITSLLTPPTSRVPLLECFVCVKRETNDDCISTFVSCTEADAVCETEVRYSYKKLSYITKGCRKKITCELEVNGSSSSCDNTNTAPACYYCCNTSKCNMNVTLLEFRKARRKRSTGSDVSLKWNNTMPKCIDVEAPIFHGCPINPLVVNATSLPAVVPMEIPVVIDNSGMQLPVVVEPSNFSLPYLIYQDTVVRFSATDLAGNKGYCVINIQIKFPQGCLALTSPDSVMLTCTNDYVKTKSCSTKCKNGTTAVFLPKSNYTCSEGGEWEPSSYIPHCVNNEVSECPVLTYNVSWALIPEERLAVDQCDLSSVTISDNITYLLTNPALVIKVVLVPPILDSGKMLVRAVFNVSTSPWFSGTVCPTVNLSVLDNVTMTNSCNITVLLTGLHTDAFNQTCRPGYILFSNDEMLTKCWPCPLGTELKDNVCLECSLGYYRDNFTQITCQPIPNRTSTMGQPRPNVTSATNLLVQNMSQCLDSYCPNPSDLCPKLPCQHAGTCEARDTDFVCRCLAGYTGNLCEYQINPCAEMPCHYGYCMDNYINNTFTCTCYHGFTGSRCTENIDNCVEQPCRNGGSCIDLVESYLCNCTDTGFHGSHCEFPDNNCSVGSCLHAGTCKETRNNITCSCLPGYTGDYCQFREDPCVTSPCGDNQECMASDEGQRYCLCKPGYTGPDCATAVHCNDSRCNFRGFCEDKISDHICHCKSGFTGESCDTAIIKSTCLFGEFCETTVTTDPCQQCQESCLLNPCKNVANCTTTNDSYTCTCDGENADQNCQINSNDCRSKKPCQNGGTCVDDLVDGYICTCGEDFTGQNCTDEVDACRNSSCLHGKCLDKLYGFVCLCDDGWSGKNCTIKISPCFSRPCLNDGSCQDLQTTNFSCLCTQEFTGMTCDTKILPCDPNPCFHDGVCTGQLGNFSCSCSHGYYGNRCENSMQECNVIECLNGGRCIEGRQGCQCPSNFIGPRCEKDKYTDYDMVLNGRSFGFCGRDLITQDLSEMSLCLWMYITRANDSILKLIDDDNGQSLLEIYVDKVTIQLYPLGKQIVHLKSNLSDRSWHLVCVTWSAKTNGQLVVFVDKHSIIQNIGYGLGKSVWSFRVQLGSHNYGSVTGINLYSYAVDINHLEMTSCSDNNGDVINWGDFLSCAVNAGIAVHPSRCFNMTQCASSLSCSQIIDKVPPEVRFCPDDVVKVVTANNLLTTVSWTEPRFYDESGIRDLRQTHQSGQIFTFGEYLVVYAAFDYSSNSALCSFTVIVTSQYCKSPEHPLNGNVSRVQRGNDIFYTISCLDGFTPVEDVAQVYRCGLEGIWDPPHGKVFTFPPCAGYSLPGQLVTMTILMAGPTCLGSAKLNILNLLRQQLNTANISVDCVFSGKTKRSSDPLQSLFKFSISSSSLEKSSSLVDQLKSVLKDSEYTIEDYTRTVTQTCGEGQVLNKRNLCVNCGKGYYYNRTSRQCELCPISTYTSIEKQTTCMSCAQGQTTLVAGSYMSSQCFFACEAGQYSLDGKCEMCDIGYYQDMTGATTCKPCPLGTTTRSTGTALQSDCYWACDVRGKELDVHGTCRPCPMGMYKDDKLDIVCTPCPTNYTTPSIGAQSITDCSLVKCGEGMKDITIKGDCHSCMPPAISDSNDEQPTCIRCSNGMTSLSHGNTAVVYCDISAQCIHSTDSNICQCLSGYVMVDGKCSSDQGTSTYASTYASTSTSTDTNILVVVLLCSTSIAVLTIVAVCLCIRRKLRKNKMSNKQRIHRSEFQSSFPGFALALRPMHEVRGPQPVKGKKKRKRSGSGTSYGEILNSNTGTERTNLSYF